MYFVTQDLDSWMSRAGVVMEKDGEYTHTHENWVCVVLRPMDEQI